jgi:hypothetical protein
MAPFLKAVRPSTTTSLLTLPVNGSPGELFSVLIPSCNSTDMYVPEGTVSFAGCFEASRSEVVALVHAGTPIESKNPIAMDVSMRLMSVLLIYNKGRQNAASELP